MTNPMKPAEGKLSAEEFYNINPDMVSNHLYYRFHDNKIDAMFTFADAYAAYCSQADAEKVACQEKALKIAIDATVVMREKIERLEKRLEDCNKGYTMASQIAAKTAKKYLDAEEKIAALETKNTELLANLKRLTLARQGDVAEIKELREGLEANCGYQRITECAKVATVPEKKEKP